MDISRSLPYIESSTEAELNALLIALIISRELEISKIKTDSQPAKLIAQDLNK